MTDQSIAQTILQQLGGQALMMLGAKDFLHADRSLSFKVRGSKVVSHIRIELAPSDTYTVTFLKIRGVRSKTVAGLENIYVDRLHQVIEKHTGLYTKL